MPALSHVSFTAEPGQTVALVGPSGGGKTTAASLIPRFWDATSGAVKVGGVDVRQIDPHVLMDQIAFVFQNSRLFKASVLENVRAARPNATREQVLAALHGRPVRGHSGKAAPGHGHPDRLRGHLSLRRRAAAHRPGPGHSEGRAHRGPGRGHRLCRPRERGADSKGLRRADPGPHRHHDRPPPVHRRGRGQDSRAGGGPHRGAGLPSGADRRRAASMPGCGRTTTRRSSGRSRSEQ